MKSNATPRQEWSKDDDESSPIVLVCGSDTFLQLIPNSCPVACGDSYAVLLPSTCLRPPPSTETRCFIVLTALLHCVTVCLFLQVTGGHCMWSVSEKGRGWCVQGGRRGSGCGLCVGRVVCVL